MDKKERFQKAYAYLIGKGAFKTKKELAKILGSQRPSVTNAYNGKPSYLTDTFLRRFCAAFPGVFNLSWLLNGDGEMLAEKEVKTKEGDKMDVTVTIQILSNTVNLLQNELQNVRQELRELKAEVAKLQRAQTGYGPMVAAEDAQHYGIKESNF